MPKGLQYYRYRCIAMAFREIELPDSSHVYLMVPINSTFTSSPSYIREHDSLLAVAMIRQSVVVVPLRLRLLPGLKMMLMILAEMVRT